jgi:hypothetical protein
MPDGLVRVRGVIPGDLLNDGTHSVEVFFSERQIEELCRVPNLLAFEVQDSGDLRGSWFEHWPGVVRPNVQWIRESVAGSRSRQRGATLF